MKLNLILTLCALYSATASAEVRKFNLYTVEASGVKMWQPSTLVVKKGDDVEISAISKAGPLHGFTIEGYKIAETATDKTAKVIKFTADKAGIFTFKCQLHPPHLGGQLVVLE